MHAGHVGAVHALSILLKQPLNEGELANKAMQWRKEADDMVENMHTGDYIRQLEREYDHNVKAREIASNGTPACEQLIQEAEAFLRNQPFAEH